ncbi:MAG: MotA/TolQ/ExbB proton channel family protein [Gemmataceae bacterium]|nr:MotA/TolQ/ExbB proton channel family protein [Gemmataceae bacterium]
MGLTVSRSRWIAFLSLCLAILFIFVVVPGFSPVYGQEEGGDKGEKKADTAAAADGKSPNLFWHIVKSAGIVFGPLLLLVSIGLVALIVLLAMDLRMGVAIPPGFVEEFTDTVNKRRFKEAFDMARNDNSFVARVMTAGMGRLQYGIEDSREAAFNMVESVKASKEQLIAYLATIGTLGPMLGLVGTVFGMILAFMELARPGSTPRPDKLADGISHALVVTLLGIGLSVPAIFCHAIFRNRLIRISMDVSNIADDLLTQMYHNSKRPPSTPGMAPPPGPSADSRAAQPVGIRPA